MSFLENDLIKVGANLDYGGSIGFLADQRRGENVVNTHDPGRWIGQSYYAGPIPFGTAHPAWKNWPWNPVSAGDVYGNASQLLEAGNDGKTLYIKSIPLQWALKNTPGDCVFETWIVLDGRCVHVRNRLTNQRPDRKQYPAMDQETPAVYTIGKLHRLMTYKGDQPLSEAPIQEIPRKAAIDGRPQWTSFDATEHWAALVDDDDWGLGIIQLNAQRFLGGFYGDRTSGGSLDDPTGYMSPVCQEILDHNIIYEYRYTLVLDSLANIRREAIRQAPTKKVPDYRFTKDRQHWTYVNVEDTGYPIQQGLRLKLEWNDPNLLGPETTWNAKDASAIYVRAAYKTTSTRAEIFWETTEQPGFSAEQSASFEVVPDGQLRTYKLNLAAHPSYRGTIRRLRFDPVESGQSGETVTVEAITAIEP